jgi:hypothetical protein
MGCGIWGRHVQAEVAPHADALKLLAYVDTISSRMQDTQEDTSERKKRVAEQKEALLRLKQVIGARLRSESSAAGALAFDARIDDDETLLRLMHAVDSGAGGNGNGAISEQELLGSTQLDDEMRKALRSAFACSQEAVEEALAHVDAQAFGEYRVAPGGVFDMKSSVAALFEALQPRKDTAAEASGCVEKAVLASFAAKLMRDKLEKLSSALTGLASTLLAADDQLDFLAVKSEAQRVPRVRGARVEWARGLGLDAALARQFPPGTLKDGLAGVRGMPSGEAELAVDAFLEDARVRILKALAQAKEVKGSTSAAEANSNMKFEGFQGSFAKIQDFHRGAEKSLKLGYPNSDTMKGILNEHTQHPSATRLFCTSNYRIMTCLLIEYAWALLGEGECGEGLKAIWTGESFPMAEKELVKARKLVLELVEAREGVNAASANVDVHTLIEARSARAKAQLEAFQDIKGSLPTRCVILKTPIMEVDRAAFSQGPGFPQKSVLHIVQKQDGTFQAMVQEQDGTFEAMSATQEPDYDETKFSIQRIPMGCDVTEYCAPENSEVSPQLLLFLKKAAVSLGGSVLPKSVREAFATATTAVWGPISDSLADLIGQLGLASDVAAPDKELLFPGEVGDRFAESLLMITFTGVPVGSPAAKTIGDKAKKVATTFLEARRCVGDTTTDEELVRGVAILNHEACMERILKGTSALLHESSGQAPGDDGSLRVGVLLPMTSVRADAICYKMLAGVKAAVSSEGVTAEIEERTWTFSRFTSVKELRKWLAEKSLTDLLKVLADDGTEKEWAHVDPADKRWVKSENPAAYESLCEAMVSSFVRKELQSDLRAALRSSRASEAQKNGLLRVWNLESVEKLDSEEKWNQVEGWVRLHQGRIQGRTRLGLKALMAREVEKIELYGLTVSEVLGMHIYTGANFVPLNGICRSFPQSILKLLEGNNTKPNNKMSTTLFCISSCLKKLSQNTVLPESRCHSSILHSWRQVPFIHPALVASASLVASILHSWRV